jgi:ubiquinone biosynthesis protein
LRAKACSALSIRSLVPPPGQLALRMARSFERPASKSKAAHDAVARADPARPCLSQARPVSGDAARRRRRRHGARSRKPAGPAAAVPDDRGRRPSSKLRWNALWRQLYASFGPPVAAASIAQVHRAEVDKDGVRKVAVKVLRPACAQFRRDLGDFASSPGCKAERAFRRARRLRLIEIIETMARSVAMEMDLRLEAAACPRWREHPQRSRISACRQVDWERTARMC